MRINSFIAAMRHQVGRLPLAILIVIAWIDANAQSSLPQCPTDTSVEWTACVGTYTFPNGDKYSGEYKYGKHHGLGTYTRADGVKHVGEFKDGIKKGFGSLTSASGDTLVEGLWLSDEVYLKGMPWRYIAGTDDGSDHYFVFSQSIRREGALRQAWIIVALSEPNPRGKWRSVKALLKFDCADDRYLPVTQSAFSGAFGAGDELQSLGEGKWDYVAPGSVLSPVMRYVCDYQLTTDK